MQQGSDEVPGMLSYERRNVCKDGLYSRIYPQQIYLLINLQLWLDNHFRYKSHYALEGYKEECVETHSVKHKNKKVLWKYDQL